MFERGYKVKDLSVRSYKEELEKRGRLITIKKPVSPEFEMSAVLRKVGGTTGVFFEKIEGYDMPAVSGLCGSREDWAYYFGVSQGEVRDVISRALANPIPWQKVESGACQEVVINPPVDLLKLLPVPKFSEKDSGRFITAGIVIVKEEETGNIHASVRRMQINSDGTISVLIESPGLLDRYFRKESRGEDMEMAIILGCHPVFIMASQVPGHLYTVDKLAVAGALFGQPVPVVPCKTIDLVVPADAEIVIEGRMKAHLRHTEGPFGELAGYYGPATEQPYMEITCVTHRKNPWFQVIAPGTAEHKMCGAFMREIGILETVKKVVPGVKDVHVTMPGGGRFHAVLSIDKQSEGEGKTAILAALGSNKDLKHVVVVNDDVDIFDPADVEAAIASRVQADEDVVIVPGARGSGLDPSNGLRGVTAKMGIDATYPLSERERFARIKTPGLKELKLEDYTK